jgi:nicotinate-nucleotide--dimethylbenzimidazole phosphoribosyltransferase
MTHWLQQAAAKLDSLAREAAQQRQGQLTKPPGALGRLEDLAISLAAQRGREKPAIKQAAITVFAADHGIADEGVSAFPQAVTVEMIRNFSRGGAAISVLARQRDARLEVVNVGTVTEVESLSGVVDARVMAGTQNFTRDEAMTGEQMAEALNVGREALERARQAGSDLFIGGEMGIANTSAATAVAAALGVASVAELAGPGTGLDAGGVSHKVQVLEKALAAHQDKFNEPLNVLRTVGGLEIAALCGAFITAAQAGMPVLVDGFIATSAALLAVRINPSVKDWLYLSHASAEPGHRAMVADLGLEPLIDLGMRLGEGSGAALVLGILQDACALHNEMATFAEAQVSEGS